MHFDGKLTDLRKIENIDKKYHDIPFEMDINCSMNPVIPGNAACSHCNQIKLRV